MGANAYNPKGGSSVRHIETTKEDRETYAQQWREDRKHKEKLKDERFAKIKERRKNNNSSTGGGRGINVEINK